MILMSSSDPRPPIWTSIFLKIMVGVDVDDDGRLVVAFVVALDVVAVADS